MFARTILRRFPSVALSSHPEIAPICRELLPATWMSCASAGDDEQKPRDPVSNPTVSGTGDSEKRPRDAVLNSIVSGSDDREQRPRDPVSSAMVNGSGTGDRCPRDPNSDPKVIRLRELMMGGDSAEGWEKSWKEGTTPWELGRATPVVEHLAKTGRLPKGRILVPGCGSGYDVVAMSGPERYVVGLEISETAVKKAKELSRSSPNETYFSFLSTDFFSWHPDELFDVIFDYLFFCAINPCLRPAWAKKVNEILKPDGELITLISLLSDQVRGPPYDNTLADYEKVLHPLGFRALSVEDNALAIGPRRGREKLGRWKRISRQSAL